MAKRKVESIASAIVRSLSRKPMPRGRRASVASVSAARGLRSPAVGGKFGRGPAGAQVASRQIASRSVASRQVASGFTARSSAAGKVDLLVGRLASAVERRLGQPGASAKAVAPPQPLSNARIVDTIAAQVASEIPPARPSQPVHVAALDATVIAAAVAKRITSGKIESHDPATIVASQVVRRLSALRVEGSAKDAEDFQRRVAAAVVEVLKREELGAEAAKAETSGADDSGKSAAKKRS